MRSTTALLKQHEPVLIPLKSYDCRCEITLFFNTFAGIPEVLDKYLLIAGLLLFLCVSANSRREKRSLFWTIILSSLVARLVLTPIVHLLYYQPHPFSLSQLRLLVSEKND